MSGVPSATRNKPLKSQTIEKLKAQNGEFNIDSDPDDEDGSDDCDDMEDGEDDEHDDDDISRGSGAAAFLDKETLNLEKRAFELENMYKHGGGVDASILEEREVIVRRSCRLRVYAGSYAITPRLCVYVH